VLSEVLGDLGFDVRLAFQALVDDLDSELAAEYVAERYISMETILDLIERESPFFAEGNTSAKERLSDIATLAFKETCDLLKKTSGRSDPSG